jgi:hypothetical protein
VTELGHLDDEAHPCTRHPAASLDAILQLATIGSRMSGFNHDLASKLQGLMMALDEILDAAPPGSDLARAAESGHEALQGLNKLLAANRALARPPVRARITLAELAGHAAERYAVSLRGVLPAAELELVVPLVTHALALAFDASAGVGRGRTLAVTARLAGGRAELRLAAPAMTSQASESLALASWVFAREGGELRCGDACVIVRLPIVTS